MFQVVCFGVPPVDQSRTGHFWAYANLTVASFKLQQPNLRAILLTLKKKKNIIKKFPIKIKSNGEWFYQNELIQKKALIKLFSSVLVADSKGNFYLETPAEKGKIEVVDAPFIITDFNVKVV